MRDLTEIEQLPTLTRRRLTLRPWRAGRRRGGGRHLRRRDTPPAGCRLPHPYTLADGEEWVGDAERKWREERWANFAVEDAETGRLVASCGLRLETEHSAGRSATSSARTGAGAGWRRPA